MSEEKYFKLSDNAISKIAQLVQVAILSGTDVVDHLRTMVLESDEKGLLSPTQEFNESFELALEKMMEEIAELQAVSGFGNQEDPEA